MFDAKSDCSRTRRKRGDRKGCTDRTHSTIKEREHSVEKTGVPTIIHNRISKITEKDEEYLKNSIDRHDTIFNQPSALQNQLLNQISSPEASSSQKTHEDTASIVRIQETDKTSPNLRKEQAYKNPYLNLFTELKVMKKDEEDEEPESHEQQVIIKQDASITDPNLKALLLKQSIKNLPTSPIREDDEA
jgi:hypothetical protein